MCLCRSVIIAAPALVGSGVGTPAKLHFAYPTAPSTPVKPLDQPVGLHTGTPQKACMHLPASRQCCTHNTTKVLQQKPSYIITTPSAVERARVKAKAMGKASTTGSRRLHVFVSGRVQGVFFRAYTKHKALDLGLTGWVRNRRDGRVEVMAEGYDEDLQSFLGWLHTGSPEADVSGIESSWSSATGEFDGFDKLWTE